VRVLGRRTRHDLDRVDRATPAARHVLNDVGQDLVEPIERDPDAEPVPEVAAA
jgi:hypothetical protein